jgi:hypothetical protein
MSLHITDTRISSDLVPTLAVYHPGTGPGDGVWTLSHLPEALAALFINVWDRNAAITAMTLAEAYAALPPHGAADAKTWAAVNAWRAELGLPPDPDSPQGHQHARDRSPHEPHGPLPAPVAEAVEHGTRLGFQVQISDWRHIDCLCIEFYGPHLIVAAAYERTAQGWTFRNANASRPPLEEHPFEPLATWQQTADRLTTDAVDPHGPTADPTSPDRPGRQDHPDDDARSDRSSALATTHDTEDAHDAQGAAPSTKTTAAPCHPAPCTRHCDGHEVPTS